MPAAIAASAFLLGIWVRRGGWIFACRMLAPLTRIADAGRIAVTDHCPIESWLPGRDTSSAYSPTVIYTMFEELHSDVAEQQRIAANASHELRTPLAISRTLLDVARNDPTRDQGELIERLHTVNARAIDLTEALLLLGGADRASFTREPVDLSSAPPKKPPKRCFPSPNSARSRSTSPAGRHRPPAPRRSYCGW